MTGASTQSALRALLEMPKLGTGMGLHRMAWFLDEVQRAQPNIRFEAIKIVGSNGKGTTAHLVAAFLASVRESVGLYTSPHLHHFGERMQIDGQPMTDVELVRALEWWQRTSSAYRDRWPEDDIGAFEAFTAMALWHFSERQASNLVVEAGIGGRYDATRVIPGDFAALTSLDLEHTALLGNSLEAIAYDKSDICPPGGTLVVGRIPKEVLRRLEAYCALKDVTVLPIEKHCHIDRVHWAETTEVSVTIDGVSVPNMRIEMAGRHQVDNACVAALVGIRWLRRHRPDLSIETISDRLQSCFRDVHVPGRFEHIHQNPDVYIDVGHTPRAIACFAEALKTQLHLRPVVLVMGVSEDRDITGNVSALLPIATEVVCTRAHHRGAEVSRIAAAVHSVRPEVPTRSVSTVEAAVHTGLDRAQELGGVVVVAGSLFLAVEAKLVIAGEDPARHLFF